MRRIVMIAATVTGLGALVLAIPGTAQARFGAGAIADAATDLSLAQPAQNRRDPRTTRRTYPPRSYPPPPPQYDTVSPYRYPGSRGALDSCSFC